MALILDMALVPDKALVIDKALLLNKALLLDKALVLDKALLLDKALVLDKGLSKPQTTKTQKHKHLCWKRFLKKEGLEKRPHVIDTLYPEHSRTKNNLLSPKTGGPPTI